MKQLSYQQFAIVQGDTAQSLTEQLNAKMKELHGKHPTVSFEGLIARISYTEDATEAECLADEYEQKGVQLTCQECPCFTPKLKADGTIDRRSKEGDCPYSRYKHTFQDAPACNKLFEMINTGEVRLCLAKSEH